MRASWSIASKSLMVSRDGAIGRKTIAQEARGALPMARMVFVPDVFKLKCPDGCTGIAETAATSNADLITLLAGLDANTQSAVMQMIRSLTAGSKLA